MVSPSRRPHGLTGGMTTKSWLTWTLLLLYTTSASANATPLEPINTPVLAAGRSQPANARRPQPGRSPAEIPILNHDIPTAKFRSTDEQDVERYQALAPAKNNPAVRAPLAQSAESSGLAPLSPARLLQDWEADDIILLSTIDGALHARDRRTGQHRWTLEVEDSPMIEAIHFQHNRSNPDDMAPQDDYMFIVEPSKEGQLYAQFTDPAKGLVRLPVTVKKMATETPFTMNVNGQYLATSSEQVTKVYTLDAETGQILHEFPRSRSSTKLQPQPRCRPRTGLDFEDSACSPVRTIRLGRNTYIFTISNEQTGLDVSRIQFSEWVINRGDNDLQSQHVTSLDGNDIKVFHNGRIIGFDESKHRYTQTLDCPVARVFDVLRPVDAQDDQSDIVLLSRPLDLVPTGEAEKWRAEMQQSQRVFVNRTEGGQWYVLSELSYPGVTSGAPSANSRWRLRDDHLDLQGDLKDIVGVHVLSGAQPLPGQRLTIGAPPGDSDLIGDQPNEMTSLVSETTAQPWKRYSDGFWGGLIALILCLLVYGFKEQQYWNSQKLARQVVTTGLQTAPEVFRSSPDPPPVALTRDISPIDEKPLPEIPAEEKNLLTPVHTRTHSTVSAGTSPKKESKSGSGDDNASDGESEDEEDNGAEETEQVPEGGKKKKKTKRGTRGGRGNKKRKAGDPSNFEPKPMISTEKHLSSGMVQVGRLTYDSNLDNCLGSGSNGTAVFPGTFDGRQVAVKRLVKTANTLAEKEIRHLVSSDENPHVIRYFGKEESPSFFYIALDKFTASLDQFVELSDKYPSLISPTRGYDTKDALRQITRGVQHIHSLKLVHRDIKPQNILVRPVKTARPNPEGALPQLLFVISDFGLCKPLEDGPDSVFAATRTAAGTTGWKAPELLVSSRDAIAAPSAETSLSKSTTHSSDGTVIDPPSGRRATKAIDIFSLGCVFFYVVTRGGHPFDKGGSPLARDLNIKEDRFDTSLLRDSFNSYDYDADDLIMQMIKHNPRERPDTAGVLIHPYFWTTEQKLDFICSVSDSYEEKKQKITNIHDEHAIRTPAELESLAELAALQSISEDVIGTRRDGSIQDFLSALPRSFLNEMGKQRKYTGTKMIDLLRVIRNKKNHFHDLPTEVKDMMTRGGQVGPVEGYYGFWRERFPSLLVNLHQLVMERGLIEAFGVGRFYDGTLNL